MEAGLINRGACRAVWRGSARGYRGINWAWGNLTLVLRACAKPDWVFGPEDYSTRVAPGGLGFKPFGSVYWYIGARLR